MKKYARVFLKGEPHVWVDYNIPEGSSLANFVTFIRMQGFIAPDGACQVYVPLDAIKMIIQIEGVTSGMSIHSPTAGQA